jgi:hypothetical protein
MPCEKDFIKKFHLIRSLLNQTIEKRINGLNSLAARFMFMSNHFARISAAQAQRDWLSQGCRIRGKNRDRDCGVSDRFHLTCPFQLLHLNGLFRWSRALL